MFDDRKNNSGRHMDILYQDSLLFILKGQERRNQNPNLYYSSTFNNFMWKCPGTRNSMPPNH